jgi:hypothetical protein
MAATIRIDHRRKAPYGWFCIMSVPLPPFGSGKGDYAPCYRYPLSLGTPNVREIEPGKAQRLALKIMVLDGRASGDKRIWPHKCIRVPD